MEKSLKKGQEHAGNGRAARRLALRAAVVLMTAFLLVWVTTGCSASSDGAKSAGGTASTAAAASPTVAKSAAAADKAADTKDANAADRKPQATSAADANAPKTADSEAVKAGSPAQVGATPPIAVDSDGGFNRKLIYKANLVMEVKDYGEAQTKLRNLAALSGAFILQFTETTNDREKSGNFTIKVAAQGFASFLDGLEKISPTLQRNVQGQDVTEEYVDLEARLKAKQAVEARLLAFMDKAQKTEDLVAFSNELSKVQTDIEQIKGRMRYLDQNVALSTIELRMYQKISDTAGEKSLSNTTFPKQLHDALYGSLGIMAAVAKGLLVFAAGALPVLVLLAFTAFVIILARKHREKKLHLLREELKRENAAASEHVVGDTNDE